MARRHSPEVLQLSIHPFNFIALFIQTNIIMARPFAMRLWWNHRLRPLCQNRLNHIIRIILDPNYRQGLNWRKTQKNN